MSDTSEYLFASDLFIAERAARKQGWHPHGRTGWIKPDGNQVHFVCFAEQVAALDKHVTIYVVGESSPKLQRLDRKWAKILSVMGRCFKPRAPRGILSLGRCPFRG